MQARLIGKCIYCLSPHAPVDEHVIPKSLGGLITLQKASCLKCAARTAAIIGKATQGTTSLLGRPRIMMDMPSRNKKKRPQKLKQVVVKEPGSNDITSEIDVSLTDFVDTSILPVYDLPKIITMQTPEYGMLSTEIQLVHANIDKLQKDTIYRAHNRWSDADMPLLLATIAYACAVYDFGLESVYPSPLLPIIFGLDEYPSRWIGTAKDEVLPRTNRFLDVYHRDYEDNQTIEYRIKFFCWLDNMPEYVILVRYAPHNLAQIRTGLNMDWRDILA